MKAACSMDISSPAWWSTDAASCERPVVHRPEPGSAAPFWSLMAFTFVLLVAPQSFVPALAPLRLALVAIGIGVATYAWDRFGAAQPQTIYSPPLAIAGCLVLWAVLTVPFSYWPGGSISFLLNIYLKTLAVFWLLCNVVRTVPRLRTMAWGLVVMSAPLALTAIQNFLSGTFTPAAHHAVDRIVGYDAPLALNPNDLALILNLIVPLALALVLDGRNVAERATAAAILALDTVAVIATFSRAGFITLLTIVLLVLWKLGRRREAPWLWALILIALAGVPFLPAGYTDRVSTIFDVDSDPTGSSQARRADTLAAARFVVRNPLVGAGIGQNILALNEERGATWIEVHNTYLEYGVELGVPGLALFVALLASSVRSARAAQRMSATDAELQPLLHLATGIEISLLAFVVAAFFHPGGYQFAFYYFAGLAVAARNCAGGYA
jgi:putative inorganic carbon (HCO3(-)) transporter